jgi:predicted acetyltransferase
MTVEIRPASSTDELLMTLSPIWHYFGRPPSDEQLASFDRIMTPRRAHAAWEGGNVVGGSGAFPFELSVPGGKVRAAGLTAIGVLPTHRRRGILRALLQSQLNACRERAEPVAYLWASDDRIYTRFGFGMASLAAEINVPRERSELYAPDGAIVNASIVPLDAAEQLIAPIYTGVADVTPGMFRRPTEWWQTRTLSDPIWRSQSSGNLQCVVLEVAHEPAAYALYRIKSRFERGIQTGGLEVVEALGQSPQATWAIWRFIFEVDWIAQVKAWLLPLDHPLLLLVSEPRRLQFNIRDGTWVRLVDVKAALAARSFVPGAVVVIDLIDSFCPWNAGPWRIGAGMVDRTTETADLRCDVSALGSVYLGGFTWTHLFRALRVEELRPGAVRRADAIFQWPSAPWCPEIF